MDVSGTVGLVFGAIGLIGVIYTVYYGQKGLRKKLLVFHNSMAIPLAQAYSPGDDYRLSVLYQRKGSNEERIESVYTTFLKFANLGKEPIRGVDIAPSNPIKVIVESARTLDIQIEAITRKVNNVSIRNPILADNESSAEVHFDFLDFKDGALIKVLTVGDKGKISLSGDIIGMPEGIIKIGEAGRDEFEGSSISGWSALGLYIASLALSAFIFYLVIGTWDKIWLVVVPLFVLLTLAALVLIPISLWLMRKRSFPKNLDLPKWCRSIIPYPRRMMRKRLSEMKLEGKTAKPVDFQISKHL
ncbi:MAG: hypothetical protein ABIH70_06505 [Chloroflexota bacterium]